MLPTSLSDYLAGKFLDDNFVTPTVYATLSTTVPTHAGAGITPLTIGRLVIGYTRTGRTINNGEVAFGTVPAGDNGAIIKGWAIYDAPAAGNVLAAGPLASALAKVRAFVASADNDTLYVDGNPFVNNDPVVVWSAAAPGGLVHGTTYYVIASSGDQFLLSATLGGAAIDITADGGGIIVATGYKTLSTGDPLKILANQLPITV